MKKHFILGLIVGAVITIYFYSLWRRKMPQRTREEQANLYAQYINEIELGAERKQRELTKHEETLLASYEAKLNKLGYTYMQEGTDAFAIPMI